MEQNNKKKDSSVQEGGDVLFGMTAISKFLGLSEATVLKYMREYEDFPVKKEKSGIYVSTREALKKWFNDHVRGKG